MMYPTNKEEWWETVDKHWPDLLGLLNRFIGMTDHENIDGKLTEGTRAQEIEVMRKNRDDRLVNYLQAAWGNAPDIYGLWGIPGWNTLCDLCSESYVLESEP